ncbi:hypothetical protein DO71_1447 [Burkholderia pseudomallei]|uniref:hypothetical protein n=1 Tax=Burkholderia pseudomallei TaxID=28450 RepID=UPI000510425B|nr:hypothetical protein [Burkholderia pseudomallei]KGC79234.1 hypothetical protein DO71_1447 [Burkholderia pseudomallei]KGV09997.1 hypothetical protein X891_617 [Burkholderia pseudomallei TSV 43]KGV40981.1 hypothetical protein X893_156 [Burkholderia pseudomallei TSV 31]CAJ3408750.1 Uncharacterised protein [Burkholderia pseudomallei]CAJ6026876.1 Uncharacterised protein [Burkholderia pseudomallei]
MQLPNSVQEIAEVIGRERALYLVGQLPRRVTRDKRYPAAKNSELMLYVPTVERLGGDHPLVRILGYKDASMLCRAFGGETLKPANCNEIYRRYRDAQIARMVGEGYPVSYVADLFGVSGQTVRNAIAA